jgi:High-temperature-induced dauer-formation protein
LNFHCYREKGIGSTTDPGPSQQYDSNKTEVLRLILVLLSRQIYVPASLLLAKPSLYTLHLVQKTPRRDVLTVLCSLLNTVMNSPQANATGIGSVAGKLPYNHLVFKGEDPRSTLVSVCFQVLCALLDFQSGSARDLVTVSGESQSLAPTPRTNAFRYFLAKLVSVTDGSMMVVNSSTMTLSSTGHKTLLLSFMVRWE